MATKKMKQEETKGEPNPILDYRRREGLTQEALARKLEVSHRTVWDWENGRRPSRLARMRIKKVIGIEI